MCPGRWPGGFSAREVWGFKCGLCPGILGAMTIPGGPATCQSCGGTFSTSDMVPYGNAWVCAACKPAFFQRLQQGQSPQVAMRYAGFWIRLVAKFIDSILLYIVQMPIGLALGLSLTGQPPTNPAELSGYWIRLFISYGIGIGFGVAFTVFFLGRFGATPGKMALRLKVVRPGGAPISYWRAFGRYFAEMVSAMTCAIGYVIAGFDGQKRALHDRIAATRVIRVT